MPINFIFAGKMEKRKSPLIKSSNEHKQVANMVFFIWQNFHQMVIFFKMAKKFGDLCFLNCQILKRKEIVQNH